MNSFASTKEAAAYLAAFIDGEGTVTKPSAATRHVAVFNTDLGLIEACEEAAEKLGLEGARYLPPSSGARGNRQGCYRLVFCGRTTLQRLHRLVPLRSVKKRDRLEAILASYNVTYRFAREIPIEYVQQRYDAGEHLDEIAATFEVNAATVRFWLRRAGHPMRTRSEGQLLRRQREREPLGLVQDALPVEVSPLNALR